MTQGDQPVRARQVLAGFFAAGIIVVGVVAGLQVLVRSGEVEPPLAGPVAPQGDDPCAGVVDTAAEALPVQASALIECPQRFDGHTVTYRGEVVRAILRRGDRAWVQVNDDPYALDLGPLPEHRTAVGGNSGIPVSIPRAVAEQIRHVGNYHAHGDIIEVTGVFRRADPSDGGGPTIQAATATIDQPGRRVDRTTSPERSVVAAVLALAALALGVLSRSAAKRS